MEGQKRITIDNSGLRIRERSLLTPIPNRPSAKYLSSTMSGDIQRVAPRGRTQKPFVRADIDHRVLKQNVVVQPKVYLNDKLPEPVKVDDGTSNKGDNPNDIKSMITRIQNGSQSTLTNHFWKNKKSSKMSMLVSACAVFLIMGGVAALVMSFGNNKAVIKQVQALNEAVEKVEDTGSTSGGIDTLVEDKVPDKVIRSYSVAPDIPRFLRIKKLGNHSTRILRMTLDSEGAIKSPKSIWDTGWYEGSAVPGQGNGASLILGHVSGPNEGGIFYNLYRLTDGDEIEVEMGDGTVYTYAVVSKEEVPIGEINMNNYLVSKDVDKQGLTLMTCAGEFNSATQQYESRLAVFAVRTN